MTFVWGTDWNLRLKLWERVAMSDCSNCLNDVCLQKTNICSTVEFEVSIIIIFLNKLILLLSKGTLNCTKWQ